MSIEINQKECLRTKRLELKSLREQDKDQIIMLLTNAEIAKTFMLPDFESEEQILNLVHKLITYSSLDFVTHLEYGIFRNDLLIGFINDCGFDDEEIEIGYVIHPDHKGKGYATEAVSAVIEDLFGMGFQKITVGYFVENIASRRVMEKCGMRLVDKTDRIEYRGKSHLCEYCEIIRK